MRAFVLAGGASLGAIQAGMLRALYEQGIAPDLIVGTSAGAINGAYIASRPASPETALGLEAIWRGLSRSQIFPVSPFSGLLGLLGRSDHLVPATGLRRLLERHIEFERLEQAEIPVHVIATDLLEGRAVRLSRGDAVDAVLASAAIPGVYPPVERGDRVRLIDGGVVANTPVSYAVDLGADEIYVLPTGSPCALREPPESALGIALHALNVLIAQRLVADIVEVGDAVRLVVFPPPCPQAVQPVDFGRADTLIEAGYCAAAGALAAADSSQPLVPPTLRPHSH